MKALTLFQPYATLVALGLKTFETRSWATKYRGPIAIHSSSRFPGRYKLLLYTNPIIRGIFSDLKIGIEDFPLGAILCTSYLRNCILAEECQYRTSSDQWRIEKACGDFSRGRFGWPLRKPIRYEQPIPAKGRLGLWEWDSAKTGREE